MSRWWRAEDTSIDHPKLLRLSDAMHRAWYTLMCIASANEGELPPVEDIALRLRMKPAQVAAWVTHLVTAKLFDNDDGTFRPHNWNKRQYKSDVTDPTNATRQQRYRNRHRNGVTTVTDKRPETETETETEHKQITEAEQKEDKRRAVALYCDPPDFDEFWGHWPHKVGKPAAGKAYASAMKRGAKPTEILDGVSSYIAAKPPDRPWLNPATFLNQNRWEDQPATVSMDNGKNQSGVVAAARRFAEQFEKQSGDCLEGNPDAVLRLSQG